MNMRVYIGVRVINWNHWLIPVNASDWLSEMWMKHWIKEVKRKPDTFQCYANKDGPRPSAPLAQRCRKARFSQTRRFLSKQPIHWLFSSVWPALKAMLTPRTPLSSRNMWGFKVFRKEKKGGSIEMCCQEAMREVCWVILITCECFRPQLTPPTIWEETDSADQSCIMCDTVEPCKYLM